MLKSFSVLGSSGDDGKEMWQRTDGILSRKYREKHVGTIPLQEENQRIKLSVSDFPELIESRASFRSRKVEFLWSKVSTFCLSRCEPRLSAVRPGQEVPASRHHDGF